MRFSFIGRGCHFFIAWATLALAFLGTGMRAAESGNQTGSPADDVPAGGVPLVTPVVSLPPPLQIPDLDAVFSAAAGDGRSAMRAGAGEIVRMALANNPDVKIQRLQAEIGDTDVRRALGFFDPKLKLTGQYSQSDTPQNTQEYIATGGQTTQAQAALLDELVVLQQQLDQLLADLQGGKSAGSSASAQVPKYTDPRTFSSNQYLMLWEVGGHTPLGTQYSLGVNQAQARNDLNIQMPPSLFYPETTTTMAFSVTQPLLKNFGPAANMAGVRISRLQRRIGWYEWKQQMIRSLSDALGRYFDLLFSYENLSVRKQAVAAARLLETQNLRRVENGKMRPSDVWEAQTALSFNVDTALRAINACIESQNALKQLILSEKMILGNSPGRLIPADSMDVPAIAVDRGRFLAEAIAKRPEYLNIVAKAEQEGIRVRFARNQAYPEVNVQASYGLGGLEQDYGNSFANMAGGQGTQFLVGVTVSVPIGNIEGRAALDAAKLRERQTLLALQKSAMEIAIEIDTAISLMETSRQQVRSAHDTASVARSTSDIEQMRLDAGKSTTFEVVRLQNNAAEARSRELAAIAAYRKNAVRLAVARGVLLDELGISLEKEAWRDVRRTSPRAKDLNEFLRDTPVGR